MFADASRSVRAIASPTSSGTCDPPGASRNTKSPCSEENRRLIAWTSSSVVDMERAYLGETGVRVSRIILGCGNFGGIGSAPELFGNGGETPDGAFAIMDAAWDAGITHVRHRRRVRRRPQRDVHRRLVAQKGLGSARRDRARDEDVQPDGRGRGPRPRAGAREAAARVEPAPARRRAHRPLSHPCPIPTFRSRKRPARSTSSSPPARSAPTG